MNDAPGHTLYVCRTCPRYEKRPPPGERTAGQMLADRVKELARTWAARDRVNIRVITCLGGCPNPCNVAVAGTGKTRLRFSRLGPDNAADVLELAARYLDSADGDLPPAMLPEDLRDKQTARTPPMIAPSSRQD